MRRPWRTVSGLLFDAISGLVAIAMVSSLAACDDRAQTTSSSATPLDIDRDTYFASAEDVQEEIIEDALDDAPGFGFAQGLGERCQPLRNECLEGLKCVPDFGTGGVCLEDGTVDTDGSCGSLGLDDCLADLVCTQYDTGDRCRPLCLRSDPAPCAEPEECLALAHNPNAVLGVCNNSNE